MWAEEYLRYSEEAFRTTAYLASETKTLTDLELAHQVRLASKAILLLEHSRALARTICSYICAAMASLQSDWPGSAGPAWLPGTHSGFCVHY